MPRSPYAERPIRTGSVPALALVLTLALSIGLAGCGQDGSETTTLRGQLVMAGQDSQNGPDVSNGQGGTADTPHISASSSARVSLIEHVDASEPDQIVAERTLHGIDRLPVGFTLDVSRQLLDRNHQYRLSGQILDDESDITWQTENPIPVDVFADEDNARLVLKPYRVAPDGPFATYVCHDDFRFQLSENAKGAVVRLGRRQISLRNARSLTPQGTRYVDAHNDEIVTDNGVTSIYFDDVSHHDCQKQAPSSAATDSDS